MKYLHFNKGEDDAEVYKLLYEGIISTTRGFEAPTETRLIGRVMDKFEAIGVASDDLRRDMPVYHLRLGGGLIELEEAEFKLTREALRGVPWLPPAVRKATAALDFFDAALGKDPTKEEDGAEASG